MSRNFLNFKIATRMNPTINMSTMMMRKIDFDLLNMMQIYWYKILT